MKIQCRLVLMVLAGLSCVAQPVDSGGKHGQTLTVLCSFYPMYVIGLNVAGSVPGVKIECLAEPTVGCLHDYQLTPADLKAISRADIFIANGAGMETFIGKALEQSPHLKVIEASRGIKLAFNDNPHVWVSLTGEMEETQNVANGLAAADPPHAAAYEQNATAYLSRLKKLSGEMHLALDGLQHRNIITFHEAFPYLAAEFNLNIVAVIEREPGSEPSARELAETIQTVRKANVKAIFAEPQYPDKSAEVIHRETGVPVSMLDPAVTGPREPDQARDSYLRTMEANLEVLVKALKD